MQKRIAILLAVLCSGFASSAQEKKPMTLDQLEQIERLDDVRGTIDRLEALIDKNSREKRAHCIRAFGNAAFCECLAENLPVVVSFTGYVQIVTKSKADLGYSDLSAESKGVVDNTIGAREVCVAKFAK